MPPGPAQRRMKAFNESCRKQSSSLVSSFSLAEKLAAAATPAERRRDLDGHDEHIQPGILTPDSNLAPAFPALGQWPWEFVIRYSGATVPDSHGVPGHLTVMVRRACRPSISKNATQVQLAMGTSKTNPRQAFLTESKPQSPFPRRRVSAFAPARPAELGKKALAARAGHSRESHSSIALAHWRWGQGIGSP